MRNLRLIAILFSAGLLLSALAIWGRQRPSLAQQQPPQRTVALPQDVQSVRLLFGIRDDDARAWDGSLRVSGGRLTRLRGWRLQGRGRAQRGGWTAKSRPRPGRRNGRRIRRSRGPVGVIAEVRGGPETRISVETQQGSFDFALSDLKATAPTTFLKGGASAQLIPAFRQLTRGPTDDDYPALAATKDGGAWVAFVSYTRGNPIQQAEIDAGRFDSLRTRGNGDQVRLMRFDGQRWQAPVAVSKAGLDVWRPAVALDGSGGVWVV